MGGLSGDLAQLIGGRITHSSGGPGQIGQAQRRDRRILNHIEGLGAIIQALGRVVGAGDREGEHRLVGGVAITHGVVEGFAQGFALCQGLHGRVAVVEVVGVTAVAEHDQLAIGAFQGTTAIGGQSTGCTGWQQAALHRAAGDGRAELIAVVGLLEQLGREGHWITHLRVDRELETGALQIAVEAAPGPAEHDGTSVVAANDGDTSAFTGLKAPLAGVAQLQSRHHSGTASARIAP